MAGKSHTDNGADFDAIGVCAIGSIIGIREMMLYLNINGLKSTCQREISKKMD